MTQIVRHRLVFPSPLSLLLTIVFFSCGEEPEEIDSTYAGSTICKPCHEQIYKTWARSQHALAERVVDEQSYRSLLPTASRSELKSFRIERAIGVEPIFQFILPDSMGQYQVSEVAYDPAMGEFLNIFGDEKREPGEWGHWTGRGMNWNSRCAACHNTGVEKNFIDSTNTYSTTVEEMGVACEACHGGLADHVAWQKEYSGSALKDPTIERLNHDETMDLCASCHSRRTEINGNFFPGDKFLDHYIPVIPDETELYFPDGQIHEEDYESISFLGSKMYDKKVSCRDCHSPHVTETGNTLCEKCHDGKTALWGTHSHHQTGTSGSNCIDCHMPTTVYMQRDARHDHGFTIPDPYLTKDYGIPNACNRCHEDKPVSWTIQKVSQWYGDISSRDTQKRARRVARARAGEPSSLEPLIEMARTEVNGMWRAVAVGLLKNWVQKSEVQQLLYDRSKDEDPLVRTYAVRSLSVLAEQNHPAVIEQLHSLLVDSIRSVRVEAAWAIHSTLDLETVVGQELLDYLYFNADQPTGALRLGVLFMDRGDLDQALLYFRRAVSWDPNSAPLRHAYAVGLGKTGNIDQSIQQLAQACVLAPRDVNLLFYYGLALNEGGKLVEAARSFQTATEIDPEFTRAWYNLGLAYRDLIQREEAVMALENAENLDPLQAYIPYARAIILSDMDQLDEAEAAARKAVALEPDDQQSRHLLNFITKKQQIGRH